MKSVFMKILAQAKSRLQMSLSSAGHSVSAIRAMSYFSKTAYYNDMTGGIALYRVIADYEEHFEEKKGMLIERLDALRKKIFCKERLMVSLTADREGYDAAVKEIGGLKEILGSGAPQAAVPVLNCVKKNEGFLDASPGTVCFKSRKLCETGISLYRSASHLKSDIKL